MGQSLLQVPMALRRSLDTIVRVSAAPVPDGDRAGFAEFCSRFTRFLHVHHDGGRPALHARDDRSASRRLEGARRSRGRLPRER